MDEQYPGDQDPLNLRRLVEALRAVGVMPADGGLLGTTIGRRGRSRGLGIEDLLGALGSFGGGSGGGSGVGAVRDLAVAGRTSSDFSNLNP